FVEAWPQDKEPIVAAINADTVGRREVRDVNVVGITKYPRLGKLVAAALEQSTLDVGKDIDQYAYAWGSDHWCFHEAGIPAVDLVERVYDPRMDEIRLVPCFAALVSGEITLSEEHDASRWLSSREAVNLFTFENQRAALEVVNRDIGQIAARGQEPNQFLRV